MNPAEPLPHPTERRPFGWIDPVAGFLDDVPPTPAEGRIRSFEWLFLIAFVGEYWSRILLAGAGLEWPYVAAGVAATAFAAVAATPRWRQPGFAGLAAVHLGIATLEFPATSNHTYLEIAVCAVAALLDRRDSRQQILYLRAVRWLAGLILLYSGIQKLAHGYWFDGQYLAYSLSRETYAAALGGLVSGEELARLSGLDGALGAGPYGASGSWLSAVGNATWILEIALAPLLLIQRTRTAAMIAAIGLVFAIEVAAREFFFGLIFVSTLLLFSRRDAARLLLGPYLLVVGLLLLSRVGILPPWTFR